jgi:hypothetical protein
VQIVSRTLADFDRHCSLNGSSGVTRPWKKSPSSIHDIKGLICSFAQHESLPFVNRSDPFQAQCEVKTFSQAKSSMLHIYRLHSAIRKDRPNIRLSSTFIPVHVGVTQPSVLFFHADENFIFLFLQNWAMPREFWQIHQQLSNYWSRTIQINCINPRLVHWANDIT